MKFTKIFPIVLLCTPLLSNAEVKHIANASGLDAAVSNKTAVVKVGAEWCPACVRSQKPFENISNDPELSDIVFIEVDADASPDIVQKYNVQGLPTFIFIKDGQTLKSSSGYSENLKNDIKSLLGATAAPAAAPAAVEKKTEEAGQVQEVSQPEATGQTAETKTSGTCAAPEQGGFFESALNAITNFFSSIADTVRGWFR